MGLCALFAGLGMGLTATKYVAEYRNSDPERIGRIIALLDFLITSTCTIAGAFLFLSSDWLSVSFFHDPLLSPYLKLGVLWLIGFIYNEVAMATLTGFEAFMPVALIQVLRAFLLLGGTWLGLHRWGALGAIWALIVSVGVSGLLLGWSLRACLRSRNICRNHRRMFQELHLIRIYSVPAVLAGTMVLPFVFAANGVIARHVGMRELGLLSAVSQWRGVMTFFPVNLAKVALAVLSGGAGRAQTATESFQIANWFNQVLLWPIALLLLFGARRLLALSGSDFVDGVVVHQIMIGGTALGFVGNVFGTVIQARGWFGIGIAGNLLTGFSVWLCTAVLVERMGAEAMSWGYLAGYAMNFTLCGYVVTRRLKVPSVRKEMAAAVVCMTTAMVAANYSAGDCSWPASIAISFLGMLFAAVTFAPPSMKDRIWAACTGETRKLVDGNATRAVERYNCFDTPVGVSSVEREP
jgi:O-antigen/teichoic acid export membrane protein